MAKIIHTFNFTTTPSNTIVDLREFYGTKWSLLLRGTFGAATIAILGGDGTTFEAVRITNPASAVVHTALSMTLIGHYTFNACCTHLKFDLTGGAGIDIDLDLFAEPRP